LARHITRKELKTDQIRETISHGAEAVVSHQQQLWTYGGLAAIVLVAVLGWRFYTQNQTNRASAALADAMKVYQARIRAVGEPAQPDEVSYVDEKNKYSDAAKKFEDVASRYPRTRPGQTARYYEALSLEKTGRNDEADKDLQLVENGSDAGLAALAKFQRAQLDDQNGKSAQALELYKQLQDKPNVFVPKAIVLLAIGDHYSSTDPAQAAKLYQQVKSEFPDTQAATQADQRLQLLPSKG